MELRRDLRIVYVSSDIRIVFLDETFEALVSGVGLF